MIVTAHRGLSSEHPENTLAAFRAAAEAGFHAIELDVRRTHDGEVVVLHDASVDRTTDGRGRVADMDYDELRSCSTGAGPVPRLDDVLSGLGGSGVLWNVEIKDRRAAPDVVALLRHHGLGPRAQCSSMDVRALAAVRDADPDAVLGLIVAGAPDRADLEAMRRLGCAWVNAYHGGLDAAAVSRLHAAGSQVGAWTVNEPVRAAALAEAGADAVVTDVRVVLERLHDPGSPPPGSWTSKGPAGSP